MKIWERWLGRPTRDAARPRSSVLSLETLERRWTPAVSVTVHNDGFVSIEDSDVGAKHNTVEIIDDYGDRNTYIKINGGPKQLLNTNAGANGVLQNLAINMNGGNDKVIFTSLGAESQDRYLARTVLLGAGNDAFKLNLGLGVSNASDLVDFGQRGVGYTVFDQAGNDAYEVTGGFQNGSLDVRLIDQAGDDAYRVGTGAVSSSNDFHFGIEDHGAGSNKFKYVQGNTTGVDVDFVALFKGGSKNTIDLLGDKTVEGGSVTGSIHTGDGKDVVKYNDNYAMGSRHDIQLYLYGGEDSVKAVIDGKKSIDDGIVNGGGVALHVSLGDGEDQFTGTIDAKHWMLRGSGPNATGIDVAVHGGGQDDVLKLRQINGDLKFHDASIAEASFALYGEAGDDAIDLALGKIAPTASAGLELRVTVDGGAGEDELAVAATLADAAGVDFLLDVDLGLSDGEEDELELRVVSAAGATQSPNLVMGSKVILSPQDEMTVQGLFFGKKITEQIPVLVW